jgi:hypothetical protein
MHMPECLSFIMRVWDLLLMQLTRYASSYDDHCSISMGFVPDWNL